MNLDMPIAIAIVVGGIGLTVIGFILKWAWTHTHERIGETQTRADKRIDDMAAYVGREFMTFTDLMEKKADNTELTRSRDAQVQIFDQIRQHELEDRNQHGNVLSAIGRLEGKMDALLARKRGNDR